MGYIRLCEARQLRFNCATTDVQHTEWSAFVNGTGDFTATIRKDYFPYFTQGKTITTTGLELYDGQNVANDHAAKDPVATPASTIDLSDQAPQLVLTAVDDVKGNVSPKLLTHEASAQVFLIIRYTLS